MTSTVTFSKRKNDGQGYKTQVKLKQFYISLLNAGAWADVAHFFPPEFGLFPQHYHPMQHNIVQAFQPPQQSLPNLYGAPFATQPTSQGYPNPVAPTPSPVAPVSISTTTEFTLPEIIENRSVKERVNFIPLSQKYLPPFEERPNYETPSSHGDGSSENDGYYYPQPAKPSTMTTKRPRPIVVMDPPELLPSHQGYDYNAPPPVIIATTRPPSTPAPVYLPPTSIFTQDEVAVVESESVSGNTLRVLVKEMRCLPNSGGFFRTVLKVDSFMTAAPSVDNDSNDKRCELKLQHSYVVVDVAAEDYQRCGVHTCGTDLCLRLRFPTIRGMRTSADSILTLHCKTQDRVAVKTHALKVGVSNDAQSRSLGTYAHGGTQNQFRTHIELLRKSSNGFTRHLEHNGAVQLGEELLLRAHVLAGDGWNYTKLSDVSLQRVSSSGELLNSAQLITKRGCLNPSMQSVCAHAPIFDPPLGHKLAFKAVMFQGMPSGEELIMSMRITGCLEQQDCQVSAQECRLSNTGRRRRNTDGVAAAINGTEVSEITRITFKVIMKTDEVEENDASDVRHENEKIIFEQRSVILYGTLTFVALLSALGLIAVVRLRKM